MAEQQEQAGALVGVRPRLLTDNGLGYISGVMAEFLRPHAIRHIRTAPNHPQRTGKTECYHRTLKDEVTLVVHLIPDALRAPVAEFVDYYNGLRLHEALKNITPDDVWHGGRAESLTRRRALKVKTLLAPSYYNRGIAQDGRSGGEPSKP